MDKGDAHGTLYKEARLVGNRERQLGVTKLKRFIFGEDGLLKVGVDLVFSLILKPSSFGFHF